MSILDIPNLSGWPPRFESGKAVDGKCLGRPLPACQVTTMSRSTGPQTPVHSSNRATIKLSNQVPVPLFGFRKR
ncbi:hypothetical protein E4U42_005168 [Claviceps africana]|uniref:Uncharacterized protein n=1 Tax=Claviceps africana TaxID=83212 RepID=A0A8K0J6X7_9HYPO|nr:hypothetical protein E4U42_005168 [Claviceps africana]